MPDWAKTPLPVVVGMDGSQAAIPSSGTPSAPC
jgi:hypothetical protein